MKILIRLLLTIIYGICYIAILPVQLFCAFIHSVFYWAYSNKTTFKQEFKEAYECWFCFPKPTNLLKNHDEGE